MWHKPCRTFHPWCLCIKTRCLCSFWCNHRHFRQRLNWLVRYHALIILFSSTRVSLFVDNSKPIDACNVIRLLFDYSVSTLRSRQNGRRFADDTFKRIFLNENIRISIKISLKFVPKGPINNIPALVQIMAWRRSGVKPLSEPMMVSLSTHICVTRPQWVSRICINWCLERESSLDSKHLAFTCTWLFFGNVD